MPYSSFFFKPAHTKGVFFPVTSLKNSDIKKRNVKNDSIYVFKTIKKLLVNEKMADDLVLEQAMKINRTAPNCRSDVENYARGRMGGKDFQVYGRFPNYGARSITSPGFFSKERLIIEVNNKCKIVNSRTVGTLFKF